MQATAQYHSLYIHVPFCQHICDYCDLYSIVENKHNTRQAYLNKIDSQLKENRESLQSLQTIFIGGGTPSQLSPSELVFLLKSITKNTSRIANCEFTIENNPSSTTKEKLSIMQSFGVNRISLGAQSTTRKTRNTLGRRTSKKQLENALQMAWDCSINNINIDLIYGIPGQSIEDWQIDLDTALSYKLQHYSAYSLILEENTPISEKFSKVDDDLAVEMYKLTEETLETYDIKRYEISNYSQKDKHCRHNYDIWKGASYLGLGPAAASFDGQDRWSQIRDLKKWLTGAQPEIDIIPLEDRLAEIIGFGFRTVNGWRQQELENLLGTNAMKIFAETFNNLISQGLIQKLDSSFRPTEEGLLFADTVAESFILN